MLELLVISFERIGEILDEKDPLRNRGRPECAIEALPY